MIKPTVTIGIPAYNEEANIGYLVRDLLNQIESNFELQKIIVSSDASTDKTNEIVKAFSDKRVSLLEAPQRQGQAARQNEIISHTNSEILVLLNADIQIKDQNLVSSFVTEIIDNNADLVCGPLMEIEPKTYFEKVLQVGSAFRRQCFAEYKNGINIFSCHGSHRAFSKNLYSNFRFQGSVAEDAYSYLYCIKNGFKYAYSSEAKVYIKLPDNLKDHINQSKRFFVVKDKLPKDFDKRLIDIESKWPFYIFTKRMIKSLSSRPIETATYCLITLYVWLYTKLKKDKNGSTWQISTSSKSVMEVKQ